MPAPLLLLGAAAVAAIVGGIVAARTVGDEESDGRSSSESTSSFVASGDDIPLGPAFPGLVAMSVEERRAFWAMVVKLADQFGLDPRVLAPGLARTIQLESTWDPSLPKGVPVDINANKDPKIGLARGGLNQVTMGAKMPEFDTPAKVWGIRDHDAIWQFEHTVGPYFAMQKSLGDGSAIAIYKRNLLPGALGYAEDEPLGVKGSDELIRGSKLSKGSVYSFNSGFDWQKRGFWTWADVAHVLASRYAAAHGQWVTISGALIPAPGAGDVAGLSEDASSDVGFLPALSLAPKALWGLAHALPLAPALARLLADVNAKWPNRSTINDGDGPEIAADKESDHGAGLALDIGCDPANGPNLDELAVALLKASYGGEPRVEYVLWKNKAIAPNGNGTFEVDDYCGPEALSCDPHSRRLHVSVRASTQNRDAPWNLSGVPGYKER